MIKKLIKTISYIKFWSSTTALALNAMVMGALLSISLAAPAAAQTVAIITDLTGKARIQAVAAKRSLTILSEINAGMRLQLDGGARLVVLYTGSGDEYAISGPALLEFGAVAPEAISGAKPQKQINAIGKSADFRIKTASTTQAGYVMRSISTASRLKLLSPKSGKILTITPEFRWANVQPGVKYQFDLADETGKSLYEVGVVSTALQLPASVALKEGFGYTWQVSVRMADGRRYSITADFSVATAGLRARAESLRPVTGAPVSERVVYAAWLDQEGLKDEARKHWLSLASERPEDSKLRALVAE